MSKSQAMSTNEPSAATLFLSDTRMLSPSMLDASSASRLISSRLQALRKSCRLIMSSLSSRRRPRRLRVEVVSSDSSACSAAFRVRTPSAAGALACSQRVQILQSCLRLGLLSNQMSKA